MVLLILIGYFKYYHKKYVAINIAASQLTIYGIADFDWLFQIVCSYIIYKEAIGRK